MHPLRLIASIVLLTLVTASVACNEEEAAPAPVKYNYTLEVKVEDSQGNRLPKVPVTVDDKVVGHTDADGKFTATLSEFEGGNLTLGVLPIEGYRYDVDTDSVTEMLKTAQVGSEKSGVPIFLETTAESLKKDYFVWFKAACDSDCGGWPVLLNGAEVAQTNALGYAHFSFTEQPRNDVEVEVSTPGAITPSNPKYAMTLDRDSTAYHIEQPFADPNKPKPRVRKSSRKKGKKGKGKGKKAAAKAPDKDGFLDPTPKKNDGDGIDLFGP